MTAKEVQDLLGVGRTTAYQVINELNKNFLTWATKSKEEK